MASTQEIDRFYYYPDFLGNKEGSVWYNKLFKELEPMLEQHQVVVFGNKVDEPRKSVFCGQTDVAGYNYSGSVRKVNPVGPVLMELKTMIETYLSELHQRNFEFNAVLCNLYEDGKHNIGYHSDDERDLVTSDIASISLGAERKFRLRKVHDTNGFSHEFKLKNGSLFLMTGDCQKIYKHSVPKELKIHEPRLNLTFRVIRYQK